MNTIEISDEDRAKVVHGYSYCVMQSRESALEFIEKHQNTINLMWPNAYDTFLLNVETRYFTEYLHKNLTILNQVLCLIDTAPNYTSTSAIVVNYLKGCLDNRVEIPIDKKLLLLSFIRDNPTKFSIEYFVYSISKELFQNEVDIVTLKKFYIGIKTMYDKAVKNMSEQEKLSLPSFVENKIINPTNWLEQKIYSSLNEELKITEK